MPKLTQVKETKRGRYALFFDGEFAFSLDEDTFAMAGLHTGDELEEWQIHDLQTKSDTRKAVDKAMDLLALRDHAAGELYQKLCRSFDPHSAAAAVAKMQELNLLDDAGFARRRAAELLLQGGALQLVVAQDLQPEKLEHQYGKRRNAARGKKEQRAAEHGSVGSAVGRHGVSSGSANASF